MIENKQSYSQISYMGAHKSPGKMKEKMIKAQRNGSNGLKNSNPTQILPLGSWKVDYAQKIVLTRKSNHASYLVHYNPY